MKTCTKCKEEKNKSEFTKSKNTKDRLQYTCNLCKKLYREENKEQGAEYFKLYQQVNKNKLVEYQKLYKQKNKEKLAKYSLLYRKENKEKLDEYFLLYRKENKEKKAVIDKLYQQANPDKCAAASHKRRALKRNSGGTYIVNDITSLILLQKNKCLYCKVELILEGKGKYHVDHRMPLFLGGSNYPDNLQILCPRCNLSKGGKHPTDYEQSIGHVS